MEKTNTIQYPVIDPIAIRKSIRAFDPRPLEPEKIHSLFEAARWSFSAGNEQAWRYIYGIKGQQVWEQLFSCLNEANQVWCADAPVLMISLAKKETSKGQPYRHNMHDTGAATVLMAIQAASMGFQIHPMAGFSIEQAKTTLNIPDELEIVAMIACGYHGTNDEHLKDFQKKAEHARGERFVQEAFAFNKIF